MRAIRIHETGGPEKLRLEELPEPVPGAGQLGIRVEAAGVNFIDTYHRRGLYPVPLPRILGGEAAGVVTAVGPGVVGFKPGDRVVSARAAGGYADQALLPAEHTVPVPAGVDSMLAAALFAQGLTAHCLACDVFPLQRGHAALVHAAAGGVGLLLVQLAKHRGARVLATVGSEAKAAAARGAGADEVCIYTREDFPPRHAPSRTAAAWMSPTTAWVATRSPARSTACARAGCLFPTAMPAARCRPSPRCC
jgi:NADPH2:quinone reductase